MSIFFKRFWFIMAVIGFLSRLGAADEVVALISSNATAYQEALTGLEEELSRKVTAINVQDRLPAIDENTKVVVTFGGKAALSKIPKDTVLIYCLAPTVSVGPQDHPGPRINIRMLPNSTLALSKMKNLNPNLKTLAVLWGTPIFSNYIEILNDEASSINVSVLGERLIKEEDLPTRLRELKGKVDAIWLLPDPLLVSQENLSILSEFSAAYKIPLYLPTSSLVKNGGGMSISVNFKNMGREAGRWAKTALQGPVKDQSIYSDKVELAINLKTLNSKGIRLPENIIKIADILIE